MQLQNKASYNELAGSNLQVLRCGPPPMNKAMAAHLDALGYTSDMQFQF